MTQPVVTHAEQPDGTRVTTAYPSSGVRGIALSPAPEASIFPEVPE